MPGNGSAPQYAAVVELLHVVNASGAANDALVDELQRELDELRGLPSWAVAVIVLLSLVGACLVCQAVTVCMALPFYHVWLQFRTWTSLVDEPPSQPYEEPTTELAPAPPLRTARRAMPTYEDE